MLELLGGLGTRESRDPGLNRSTGAVPFRREPFSALVYQDIKGFFLGKSLSVPPG